MPHLDKLLFGYEHRIGRRVVGRVLAVVLGAAFLVAPAPAAPPAPFVMGTEIEETTLYGKWYRRVFGEAFARMGVPLTMETVPTARLTILADQGEVHGQSARILAYADTHPNQQRVEEVLIDARLGLFAYGPSPRPDQPNRIEDLAAGKWRVEYRRGVAICEKTLKPIVPAERLSDVTSIEQGLKKLKVGRTDFYCDIDTAVRNELTAPAYKGESGYRKALDLGASLPLYPYVHKSRAELVPSLAETLRKMKAEGLFDRYLREAEHELGVAR